MQKVFNVAVDIGRKLPAPAFDVNTNDLKSVKLLITITNGQTLLDLTDTTVRIAIRKPDNNIIFQDCTIKDAKTSQVEIVLENQAYITPGTHTAEIMCYKGSDVVAVSGTFSYKSTKGIMNDEAVESKSEFTSISNMMKDVQDTIDDIRKNGTGVDAKARQDIQSVTTQLAEKVSKVNGKTPDSSGNVTIEVPQVDTSKLATKDEVVAKSDKTYVDIELNKKRSIDSKIKGSDLDTAADANKVKLINLSDEVKQAMAGTTPINASVADGGITQEKYADGSFVRAKAGTSLGSLQDGFYISNTDYYLTRNGTDIKIKFKQYSAGLYKNIERRDTVALNAASVLEYTITTGSALVYNIDDKTKFYVKSIDALTSKDLILLVNNNGIDVINKLKTYRKINNYLVFVGGSVSYEVINGGLTISFSGDMRLFVRTGDNGVNITYTIPEPTYVIPSGSVLVFNLYTQSLVVRSFDALFPDDIVLIGNQNNKPLQNNIGASATSDWIYRQYGDDIIVYGTHEGVNVEGVGGNAVVTFGTTDTRLFYKTSEGNKEAILTKFSYSIPTDHSLVLNKATKELEVVDSNKIARGKQLLLLAARYGKIVKSNIRHTEKPSLNTMFPISPKRIDGKYSFSFSIAQDGTVVEDEIWLFDESLQDHVGTAPIHKLDKHTLEEKGIIQHNLGHANGVDYTNGHLLVYNGAKFPPEINIYKNPYGKNEILTTHEANTQIIFKEGNKLLEGDGSACFGENEKIVYYNAGATIYKILLGMGDNDLSDKTTDKTDTKRWGTFQSGKTETQYNGTAQILNIFKIGDQLSPGQIHPQGMTYNGHLYIVTGFENCHAYKVELLSDNSFRVRDDYHYNYTNHKNEKITVEPQVVFLIDDKIYLGFRHTDESFLVKMQL